MSIATEIARISGNISDSLSAVSTKGVTVPAGSTSDDLAGLIALIQTGSGGGTGDIIQDSEGYLVLSPDGGSYTWETLYNGTQETHSGDTVYIYIDHFFNGSENYINQGDIWRVVWDGTPYVCTATEQTQSDYGTGYLIGNATIVGGVSGNNEPFACVRYNSTDLAIFTTASQWINIALSIEKRVSSGGGPVLVTKTITANGTYDPEDDDADGYSEVIVNVPSGSSKAVYHYEGLASRTANSYGATNAKVTVTKAGTYNISYIAIRGSSSGTMGTNLHIGDTAKGNNTTWNSYGQYVSYTNQSIAANTDVTIYATSGNNSRTIYTGQLIVQEV